jgi:hypothetical protein
MSDLKAELKNQFPQWKHSTPLHPKNVAINYHKLMMMMACDKNTVTAAECLQI